MASHAFQRPLRRIVGTAALGGVVTGLLVAVPVAATAADGPAPMEQRDPAATVTADPLPTVQLDSGIVWAQTMVGNTVYAGGAFSDVRPAGAAAGTSLTARSNLVAYDITTGQLVAGWAPSVNGTVKALAASPDGSRIYVGGSFTVANGVTRYNLAAFDAKTGALVTGFAAAVGGSYVNAIVATNGAVYVGGLVGAGNGVTRRNFAAFAPSNGALLGWAPTSDLQVDAMVLDPAGDKLIAGGRFGTVNDVAQRGLVALDLTSGAIVPWEAPSTVVNGVAQGQDGAGKAGIFALTADADTVYGTGWVYANKWVGNLEGTFAARTGSGAIKWVADCHGDHYGVYSDGRTVYTTGHEHACETIGSMPQGSGSPGNMRNASAYTAAAKGTLSRSANVNDIYADWSGHPAPAAINWFPDWLTGTASGQGQAGWSVTGNGDFISVGGEFPGVNNQGQRGLVRFARRPAGGAKQAPRLSGDAWVPTATSARAGQVRVSIPANWDRDDLDLTYELLREGTGTPVATATKQSTYFNQPRVQLADTTATSGQAYGYRVRAKDGDGNTATSAPVNVTVSTAELSGYAAAVLDDGATSYWRLGGGSSVKPDLTGVMNADSGPGLTEVAGAIQGDGDAASRFSGDGSGWMATQDVVPTPGELSTELWFKTATTQGGKLIGYGRSKSDLSGSYDRHVYMQNDGRLTFGSYPGGVRTVTTPAAYNDDRWHHVVATQGPSGTSLYVDGALRASDGSLTSGEGFPGYWRVGGDNLNGWTHQPSSHWFAGSLDEVAVYPNALSSGTVRAHYDLGTGAHPPAAAFAAQVDDLTATFDASGTVLAPGRSATPLGYHWDFGDGSAAATGVTAEHAYAAAGSYTVTLTVTDDTGSVGEVSREVTVTAPNVAPVASFEPTASGLSVAFDGTGSSASDGATVASYEWDFGDGTASTQAKPTHVYQHGGGYDVRLRVTDSRGATGEVTKRVTVTHADPVAAFDAAVTATTVSVDASGSTAADGAALTYAWSWGDGSAEGAGRTATHAYGAAGSYDVTLRVTDSLGGTHQVTKQVTVEAQAYVAKDAFGRTVATGWGAADQGGAWTGTAGLSVSGGAGRISLGRSQTRTATLPVAVKDTVSRFTLSADKVADGGGMHLNYLVHRSTAGDYRLKLRFSSAGAVNVGVARTVGTTETLVATKVLTGYTYRAGAKLDVAFETTTTAGSTRLRAKVWPHGQGEPTDWTLTTTDAQAALQTAGQVGFVGYGTSTVTNGPVTLAVDDLTVAGPAPEPHAKPVAAFTASTQGLTTTVDASASTASDGATLGYAWAWGDGTSGTGRTAAHTYAAAGSYPVTLTVTDSLGATHQVTRDVTVTAQLLAVGDAFARSVTSGWGTADAGGTWTTPTTGFSVAGGAGRISLGASQTRTATLPVSLVDTVSRFVVTTDKVANGGGAHLNYLVHRSSAGDYRLKLRFGANGVVNVGVAKLVGTTETLVANKALTGYTHTAGSKLQVLFEVVEEGSQTRLRAKVWAAGQTEPTDWTVSTTDAQAALQAPGQVGFSGYGSGTMTNGPVVISIDDLTVS